MSDGMTLPTHDATEPTRPVLVITPFGLVPVREETTDVER